MWTGLARAVDGRIDSIDQTFRPERFRTDIMKTAANKMHLKADTRAAWHVQDRTAVVGVCTPVLCRARVERNSVVVICADIAPSRPPGEDL